MTTLKLQLTLSVKTLTMTLEFGNVPQEAVLKITQKIL